MKSNKLVTNVFSCSLLLSMTSCMAGMGRSSGNVSKITIALVVLLLSAFLFYQVKSILKANTAASSGIFYLISGLAVIIISQTVDSIKYSSDRTLYYSVLFAGIIIFIVGGVLLAISKSKE